MAPSEDARATTYRNPLRYDDGVERPNPDPFVMRFRGRYYCYSSGEEGVGISVSDDLVAWSWRGHGLRRDGRRHYWAPCVIYARGLFWMYFSDRPRGSDNPHDEVLQVATSPDPEGPFTVRGRFFDTFSLDPHVVRDPESGEYVMFYSTNEMTGLRPDGTGTSIVVDRLVEMDRLAGDPRPVVLPTLDEEIFARNRFGDGRDWYTIEGATYFARRRTAFLTYSGNAYTGSDYFIGYSRAQVGGPIPDLSWHKYPEDYAYAPLVRRSADVVGTGHNSVVKGPDLVEDWLVYHGRDADQPLRPDAEQRLMRIDRLVRDGDRLTTDAPTTQERNGPAGPTLFEDFRGPLAGGGWTVAAGSFSTVDRAVRSASDLRARLVHERDFGCYRAEAYLRARPGDSGARYGLLAAYEAPTDHVALVVDAARRRLEVVQTAGGFVEILGRADLAAFDPTRWLCLEVERTFDVLDVRLEDRDLLQVRIGSDRPGRIGLLAESTVAEFSALTVTEHVELWGERMRHLPALLRADRPVELGADGAAVPGRRPARLTGAECADGTRLVVDIDLTAPYGRVEITLADPVGDGRTSVVVSRGTYRVLASGRGPEAPVAEGALADPRLSVEAVLLAGSVRWRLGGDQIDAVLDHQQRAEVLCELAGASVVGLQLTTAGELVPGETHQKDASETP